MSSGPSGPSPPPPPASVDPALDPALQEKLIASGDRDRLQRLLAERLEQCGWTDQVAALARDELAANEAAASAARGGDGATAPRQTVDALAAALRPRALAAVPDGIKAELLAEVRAAVLGVAGELREAGASPPRQQQQQRAGP